MSQLDALCKALNKEAKEEIAQIGMKDFAHDVIPLSSPRANYSLYGGIPIGRIIEFAGEEGGGKTTTALDVCANAQRMFEEENPDNPRKILYLDAENTFDPRWAKKLGLDYDKIVFIQPMAQSAEELFQFILDAIDTGEVGLTVIDSIGVLVSEQEMQKEMGESAYGGISKSLTRFSKKAEMLCHKHNCTIIGINQLRDNLNSMYGGTTTTGGRAWKHNCSLKMEFRKGDFFDEKGNKVNRTFENPSGNLVQFSITKSKCFPNDRKTGFYTLHYYKGILAVEDLVDLSLKKGYIEQGGAWFTLIDPTTGEVVEKFQGKAKLVDYIKEHEELLEKLKEKVAVD